MCSGKDQHIHFHTLLHLYIGNIHSMHLYSLESTFLQDEYNYKNVIAIYIV